MNATMTKEMDLLTVGQHARNARLNAKMTFRMMMQYCDLSEKAMRQFETGQFKGNIKYAQEQHQSAIEAYLHKKLTTSTNPSMAVKLQLVKEHKQIELLNELTKLAKRMNVVDLKKLVKSLQ